MEHPFRVKVCFLLTPLSGPCPNRVQGRPGPPKSSMFHQNLTKSDAETDLSEFSLFSSQHLWRTWGPQDGSKFPIERSPFIPLNLWPEPRSYTFYTPSLGCTFYTLLGVDGTRSTEQTHAHAGQFVCKHALRTCFVSFHLFVCFLSRAHM